MLDLQVNEHGYTECYTPYIVNAESLIGTTQLPKFEADMFAVKKGGIAADDPAADERLYLISTAEITLTNSVRGEILPADALPMKLTAHSPCFPLRSGKLRQGHAWHDPPAPVRQGRDGADRSS
jgi:seryl-tRNA synthetase